ncbi:hypothetical protein [Kingella oralis]|jgi:hypothetical protein|nr:hypothetical protein [Kingella oralis]
MGCFGFVGFDFIEAFGFQAALTRAQPLRQPETLAPRSYGLLASRALAG